MEVSSKEKWLVNVMIKFVGMSAWRYDFLKQIYKCLLQAKNKQFSSKDLNYCLLDTLAWFGFILDKEGCPEMKYKEAVALYGDVFRDFDWIEFPPVKKDDFK